jgi:copper homeostasis protein
MIVEVCLSNLTSALNAVRGGATSIELCVDRITAGGVTPSYGLITKVVQKVGAIRDDVKIHVLVRPRDGDFVYSDDEFDVILEDISAAKRAGAHGISQNRYHYFIID